jgi:protein associated with RNAse G/E
VLKNNFKKVEIQAYKHNGDFHRCWRYGQIIDENDTYVVVVNYHTKVIEKNGRSWQAKEPAVWYFFKEHWFNIIAMLKDNGIAYYCNLASPFVIDKEGLKFIDYDLDLKVNNHDEMIVLDKQEFDFHSKIMSYPDNIKTHIIKELNNLKLLFKEDNKLINRENTNQYFQYFIKHKDKKRRTKR